MKSTGSLVSGSLTRYLPFGGYRGSAPSQSITDRDFTGQRENMELGLLYYQARYYLPGVGRFVSADTIVPNPTNPQSYNRYSYVENRPINFTDPTGHYVEEGAGGGGGGNSCPAHLQPCGLPLMDEDAAVAAVNGAVTAVSAAPGIGEVVDAYDITMAVLHGDWAGATTTAGLALLPGSSRLWRGVGGEVAEFAVEHLDEGAAAINRLCSFSANTLVRTDDGLKPISEVAHDELVWAYNEETGEMGWYPVVAVWSHEDPITVYLTIEGEVIETTPEHPFFTADGEWLPVAALQVGDEIRNAAWATGTVEAIEFAAELQTMYNFTVATAHTYFVGDGQWLVHNACSDIFFKNFEQGSGFSGVYDPTTGHYLIRPSGDTLLSNGNVPDNVVPRRRGHAQVNDQLAEIYGVNPHETYGFTVFYDGPKELSVAWNSGSVNFANHANLYVPEHLRPTIMNALSDATGYTVRSK